MLKSVDLACSVTDLAFGQRAVPPGFLSSRGIRTHSRTATPLRVVRGIRAAAGELVWPDSWTEPTDLSLCGQAGLAQSAQAPLDQQSHPPALRPAPSADPSSTALPGAFP